MVHVSFDFQEGQIVQLFHGRPEHAWNIFTVPDDKLKQILAWNDPNGDFDALDRVHLLEIFISDFIQSKAKQ